MQTATMTMSCATIAMLIAIVERLAPRKVNAIAPAVITSAKGSQEGSQER